MFSPRYGYRLFRSAFLARFSTFKHAWSALSYRVYFPNTPIDVPTDSAGAAFCRSDANYRVYTGVPEDIDIMTLLTR
jgi:hypothetical protein